MTTASAPRIDPSSAPAPASARKKSRRKWWILGAVGVVLVAVIVAVAAGKKSEKPTMVTTEKASVRTITHLVTATGKVQPELEVGIAPEVSGEITALPLKEGSLVKKGDVIVQIKQDYYRAAVEQQEASLAAVKAASLQYHAQMIKTQDDFKRSEDLHGKNLVSESDYSAAKTAAEVAKATYESSLAQIRSTQGSLNQYRDQLGKTTIIAPMDGTISVLNNEVGERVVGTGTYAGTEVMRIADLTRMEVRVKVNENDIVNVKIGDHTTISVDAFPSRKFEGQVSEISSSALTTGASGSSSNQASLAASASDEVTNFLVRIRVRDPDAKLRPGMSATVDIETETVSNVVAVPIQSVTVRAQGGKTSEQLQEQRAKEAKERSGNDLEVVKERQEAKRTIEKLDRVVFIRDGATVKQRKVETGIADNTFIEIKSGLKNGEEVVSGSYAAISRILKDGAKVLVEQKKKDDKS